MNFSNPEVAAKYEMLTQEPHAVRNDHYQGLLQNINLAGADKMHSEGSRHLKLKEQRPVKPPKKEEPKPSSPAGEGDE
jgi:hypothetical protein